MYIETTSRGILTALFRQKIKLFLTVALITLVGLAYIFSLTPRYETKGSLLVKFGEGAVPSIARPDSQRSTEFSRSDRSELMQSYLKILQSHDLLRAVLADIGVETAYPGITESVQGQDTPEQAAIAQLLRSDIKSIADDRSNLIEVYVRNPDPEVAAKLADRILNMFVARQSEVYNAPQSGFLQKQIEEARLQLDRSQEEFQSFKVVVGVSDMDAEMTQLMREKSELSALAYKAVTDAQAILTELETKEAEMRATYRSDSPAMQRMRESTAVARAQLQARQDDLNNAQPNGDGSFSVKVAALNERIAHLEAQRSRYKELEQRVEMDQENYKYYQQRGEEARVNDLLNAQSITRLSLVDKPFVPVKPMPMRRLLILIATLLAATLLGLGLALVAELLDDRLTAPEQITDSLGLPVLASFGFSAKGAAQS